jgi:thiosulfate reductase cytochrome b subunit
MMRTIAPFLLAAGLLLPAAARAQGTPNPMHPTFRVLDAEGQPVTATGAPVSSDRTCGACHDAAYINAHNSHVKDGRTAGCIECHAEGSRLPTDPVAFDEQGSLKRDSIRISAPRDANCAFCHGIVQGGPGPVAIPDDFETAVPGATGGRTYALTRDTGEILSPQDVSDSFLNLQGKAARAHPWDVHSRRLVGCTACHFARNNPARAELKHTVLDFLLRDPRKVALSEFLHRPDHELVTATCRSCHDPLAVHDFLPYRKRHMDTLDCRACHVPSLAGPAARAIDATVATAGGAPRVEYRGLERRDGESLNTAFSRGYAPFLLNRTDATEGSRVAPFNLVTRWFWALGPAGAEVPWDRVAAAWGGPDGAPADLLAAFDADHDGRLSEAERTLDSPARTEAIRSRLAALGVADPQVRSVIESHPVAHDVVSGPRVRRACTDCHAERSGLDADIPLASAVPGGVRPPPPAGGALALDGEVVEDGGKGLVLRRGASPALYVFGHSRSPWTDRAGLLFLATVVAGIAVHGGLRIRASRRRAPHRPPVRKVYLYPAYERIWHWLMAFSVLTLMVTGIRIHFAGSPSPSGLSLAVSVHNVFAGVMLVNAFLSLFYHLASDAIRQFLPPRDDLVGQVTAQARYYLQGIFVGGPHPTAKSLDRKLNPLQQVTYLALLNVLFPFQALTGILIWGASRWPDFASSIGGLTIVGPLHNLGSWLLLSFFVLHLYLTTTGRTVLANVTAMIDGWEEIEVAHAPAEGGSHV